MYRYLPIRKTKEDRSLDFYDVFNNIFNENNNFVSTQNSFKIDVKENENDYIIDAYLDGAKKEDIKIDFDDENLVISVNYEKEEEEKKENYIHRERVYRSMSRSIYLPNIDEESIKAKYVDGVLSINIPKKEEESKKKPILIE